MDLDGIDLRTLKDDTVYAKFNGRTGNVINVLVQCLYEKEKNGKKIVFLNRPYKFDQYKNSIYSSFKNVDILYNKEYCITERKKYWKFLSLENFIYFGQSKNDCTDMLFYLGNRYFSCAKIENEIKKKYPDIENMVSVHVRMGDYLQLSNKYINLDRKFYLSAIDLMDKQVSNNSFLVFSDDTEKAKKMLTDVKGVCFFDKNLFPEYDDIYDFYAMRLCKHNIIANSTFSRYAALFNIHEDHIIIGPSAYLVEQLKTTKLKPIIFDKKNRKRLIGRN